MVGWPDCKGVPAQEAFSLMAGRSDDETTLGPNFFGLAQNKHEHAVSTAIGTFTEMFHSRYQNSSLLGMYLFVTAL